MNDDDHVLALFKENGKWGAVAKSNTTLLRYRDPVFSTVRELALSYFPFYFNVHGEMSLREYGRPFGLGRFAMERWKTTEENLAWIGKELDKRNHVPLLTRPALRRLPKASQAVREACFLGSDPDGLFKP